MQKLIVLAITLLTAGLIYLGWREYLSERMSEKAYKNTILLVDSLRLEMDSLKIKRQRIRSLSSVIKQRLKERKDEADSLNSIDSLVSLANSLLAGKGN